MTAKSTSGGSKKPDLKTVARDFHLQQPGIKYYAGMIQAGTPFSFIRYGDGEWSAAFLHDRPRTGSGSQDLSIKSLQAEMRASLVNMPIKSNYLVGLRPLSVLQKPKVDTWLKRYVNRKIRWHDCRVFAHASMRGQLRPLVKALQGLKIPLVLIGGDYLRRIIDHPKYRFLPRGMFITVPNADCYCKSAKVLHRIRAIKEPTFFGFSAGPATKVWIHQLYPEIGQHSFLIDFGSMWDIYAGRRTRQYQKRITPKIMKANLGR